MFPASFPYAGARPDVLSLHERTGATTRYTGRGVVIALIDSGFYPHRDLSGRIRLYVDASTSHFIETRRVTRTDVFSWHGQMTSVLAAGDGSSSQGRYRGLATGAEVVLVRVTNPRGGIKEPDILRGLQWVAANHQRLNIRVVNVAVGGDWENHDPHYPLHDVVRRLTQEGVTVVVAAGNANQPVLLPPASAPEAIIVGGVDDNNSADVNQWRLYHHNYGRAHDGSYKPDILAPAKWLPSPILPGSQMMRHARWLAPLLHVTDAAEATRLLCAGYRDLGIHQAAACTPDEGVYGQIRALIHKHKIIDAYHQHVDGTSASSAVLAGLVAQMLEANPALNPYEVRVILESTAVRFPDVPLERQGAGIMHPAAAVAAAAGVL